eukprot:9494034-Pyramimonas_sp.AAC.1
MGDVARQPDGSAVRRCVFTPGGFDLARPRSPRKRGRPRNTWNRCVYDLACQAAGGPAPLQDLWQGSAHAWRAAARRLCF